MYKCSECHNRYYVYVDNDVESREWKYAYLKYFSVDLREIIYGPGLRICRKMLGVENCRHTFVTITVGKILEEQK